MNDTQFDQKLSTIAADRSHGASELARQCLAILAESARFAAVENVTTLQRALTDRAQRLAAARPSMAPIQNLLRRWQKQLRAMPPDDLAAARIHAAKTAQDLEQASRQAVFDIAGHAAQLLGTGKTLITHSLSSTVVELCRVLKERALRMIVTESRPLCEGRRLAEQLSAWAVPTVYITDAQIGLFVAQADAVVVGADSVLADGAVVNKAGTYLLALAARECHVPVYACCESFKFLPQTAAPTLEEMAVAELDVPEWPYVTSRNIYFEITPAHLITRWITEQGVKSGQ